MNTAVRGDRRITLVKRASTVVVEEQSVRHFRAAMGRRILSADMQELTIRRQAGRLRRGVMAGASERKVGDLSRRRVVLRHVNLELRNIYKNCFHFPPQVRS